MAAMIRKRAIMSPTMRPMKELILIPGIARVRKESMNVCSFMIKNHRWIPSTENEKRDREKKEAKLLS